MVIIIDFQVRRDIAICQVPHFLTEIPLVLMRSLILMLRHETGICLPQSSQSSLTNQGWFHCHQEGYVKLSRWRRCLVVTPMCCRRMCVWMMWSVMLLHSPICLNNQPNCLPFYRMAKHNMRGLTEFNWIYTTTCTTAATTTINDGVMDFTLFSSKSQFLR